MKKLIEKDKKLRKQIVLKEYEYFVLKSIIQNLNFLNLIRWNAYLKLKKITQCASKIAITNRCLYTINKKRFNKLTGFSRHVFLKYIRSGSITGIKKSSW
jgi:ribosomal protein S14